VITAAAMQPFGMALADYFRGDQQAAVKVCREDGLEEYLAISSFFRSPTEIPMDKVALENCRGRVLDVGAGVGIHSLYLQNKGYEVAAMDVSPEACEVMRRQGVKEVHCTSFNDFKAQPFDTLLILGRSICMVETLKGLGDFLKRARSLVKPGGQIILNSVDITKTKEPRHLAYHDLVRKAGRYVGEVRLSMQYKDFKALVIGLLHVDSVTLDSYAAKAKWSCEILVEEESGNYLARLIKKD
jgi:2-polyprenyl-3-methyl-5-hydroxy-6-metoxy-1,4-benzoquinol methylase